MNLYRVGWSVMGTSWFTRSEGLGSSSKFTRRGHSLKIIFLTDKKLSQIFQFKVWKKWTDEKYYNLCSQIEVDFTVGTDKVVFRFNAKNLTIKTGNQIEVDLQRWKNENNSRFNLIQRSLPFE